MEEGSSLLGVPVNWRTNELPPHEEKFDRKTNISNEESEPPRRDLDCE